MKYIFYTTEHEVHKWKYLNVKLEEDKYKILQNIPLCDDWTPEKVQQIIDNIELSKTKPLKEEYIWGNEDVILYANENGVLLIDSLAQRAGIKDVEKVSLELTHDGILTFLQDFKKFVEENS